MSENEPRYIGQTNGHFEISQSSYDLVEYTLAKDGVWACTHHSQSNWHSSFLVGSPFALAPTDSCIPVVRCSTPQEERNQRFPELHGCGGR